MSVVIDTNVLVSAALKDRDPELVLLFVTGHPEFEWIAVKSAQVIASDPDLAGLLQKLPDPAHTCVEFITREPLEMVL